MASEVYLEFIQVGRMVKVIAVDPGTGLEATIIAPNTSTRADMERVVVRKLARLVERHRAGRAG